MIVGPEHNNLSQCLIEALSVNGFWTIYHIVRHAVEPHVSLHVTNVAQTLTYVPNFDRYWTWQRHG
jgi:hypothetical protein